MVYQVGSPAMFEGKRFLPDTGMPIWKMERRSTRLAVWLPEPLTVATWMLKSLTTAPARLAGRLAGFGQSVLWTHEIAWSSERGVVSVSRPRRSR